MSASRNVFARAVSDWIPTTVATCHALGRGAAYYDQPTVRAIVRDAARDNYRFSSILTGIIKSTPFQMRMTPLPEADAASDRVAAR